MSGTARCIRWFSMATPKAELKRHRFPNSTPCLGWGWPGVGKGVLGCDSSHLNHDTYFWMAEVCLQKLWQVLYFLSFYYWYFFFLYQILLFSMGWCDFLLMVSSSRCMPKSPEDQAAHSGNVTSHRVPAFSTSCAPGLYRKRHQHVSVCPRTRKRSPMVARSEELRGMSQKEGILFLQFHSK